MLARYSLALSMDDISERVRLLLLGLAAGDSLGSTSEFVRQEDIPALYDDVKASGWPFRQIGGGNMDGLREILLMILKWHCVLCGHSWKPGLSNPAG